MNREFYYIPIIVLIFYIVLFNCMHIIVLCTKCIGSISYIYFIFVLLSCFTARLSHGRRRLSVCPSVRMLQAVKTSARDFQDRVSTFQRFSRASVLFETLSDMPSTASRN